MLDSCINPTSYKQDVAAASMVAAIEARTEELLTDKKAMSEVLDRLVESEALHHSDLLRTLVGVAYRNKGHPNRFYQYQEACQSIGALIMHMMIEQAEEIAEQEND